ncbi:MAG: SPFH domain-containing protein [Candidatus Diapherotrites archaeon]
MSVRIVYEYQRAVLFTLGKYSGLLQPGFNIIIPIIQWTTTVDLRVDVVDVPEQTPITKDNVSISVDAVLYYRIRKDQADKAILEVENYRYAVSQLAQTTMREVIGEVNLDELLSQREKIAKRIREILDRVTDPWGIKVESVDLKEIILPESLVRVISKEAEAEREKRAILLRAQGELEAAQNLSKAAVHLVSVKGGMHLRTLQVIHSLSTEKSKTVVYTVPSELLRQINVKFVDIAKKLLE